MTEQDNILRLAREAGMNLTPAQFSGVFEDEIDEYKLAKFAALVKAEADAETRVACAKVCMDKAHKMEREAQSALAEEDEETCGSNRATAWMLSVCAREISAMGATPSREGEA